MTIPTDTVFFLAWKAMTRWGLSEAEQASTMGVADVSLWRAWSAGLVARQTPQQEQLGRMVIALARELKQAPKDWLSQPHKAFDWGTPVDEIRRGRIGRVLDVLEVENKAVADYLASGAAERTKAKLLGLLAPLVINPEELGLRSLSLAEAIVDF